MPRKRSRHWEHLRLGSLELWSHQRVMIDDSLTIFGVAVGAALVLAPSKMCMVTVPYIRSSDDLCTTPTG
ncbi:hypothetical protein ARMSODRAFT_1021217 [Armillaria solidipes]|uniref:Uncharacterized protein n=1 Tax=Armillaria solidipes TaxID=1076256 RepID=A0A2H3B7F0_9AGAR|nr:hypothetical protein ARMSODRAFT_1021217 [Armillaria solidipes]